MAGKKTDEELVAQLLATAESSNHPEEAKLARERAERLMVKLGITDAVARARGTRTREEVVQLTVCFDGTYRVGLLHMAVPIARGVGCRSLRSHAGASELLYVVGFTSDASRAVQLINSLATQASRDMWLWWRGGGHAIPASAGAKARQSFLLGFGHEAGERLRQAAVDTVAELGQGTDLVLADRSREVDAHIAQYRIARGRRMTASREGLVAGAAAARRVDLSAGRDRRLGATTAERVMVGTP